MSEDIIRQQVDRNMSAILKAKGKVNPFQPDPKYLQDGALAIKTQLGAALAAYICNLDSVTLLNKWAKGVEPNTFQKNRLLAAIQLCEVLSAVFSKRDAMRTWLLSPNDYLGMGTLPMDEMREGHSERVRKAALYLLT